MVGNVLNMKADNIVTEKEGVESRDALTATTKPELKGSVTKGHSFAEVEPYVAFLFCHWDKIARANPGFNGQAVQELLWRRWVSLKSAESTSWSIASRRTRKRNGEGAMVVADLVSEMLETISEAEEVADQLIEELLDRVCPQKKCIVFEQMAETVLGEVKEAELGLMEIRGE